MRICPNLSNPQVKDEFNELVSVLGENAAYYVWEQNNGYSLDYAPNGAQSKLFQNLYDYYKDRNKAITAKAKSFTSSFQLITDKYLTLDENGEVQLLQQEDYLYLENPSLYADDYMSEIIRLSTDMKQGIIKNTKQLADRLLELNQRDQNLFYLENNTKWLLQSLSKKSIPINIRYYKRFDQKDTAALYFPKSTEIYVYRNVLNYSFDTFASTVNHEMLHHYLDYYQEIDKGFSDLLTQTRKEIMSMFDKEEQSSWYGLYADDNSEFLNEFLSNNDFRAFLFEKTNQQNNKKQNLWQKLIHLISLIVDRIRKNSKPSSVPIDEQLQQLQEFSTEVIENINNDLIPTRTPVNISPNPNLSERFNTTVIDRIFEDNLFSEDLNFLKQIPTKEPIDDYIDQQIYYYVKDNIKQSNQNSYYSGKQGIGKLFTSKNQSAKNVLSNILNNKDFIDGGQIPLAQSLLNNLSDNVTVELVNNTDYVMSYQNGVIRVNIDAFNSYSNYDIANTFLHELLHHFTVNEYANNSIFKDKIDDLFNKVTNQFPKKDYPRKGLYYGLTSPQEFISELYVNRAFRDAVLKKNMPLWRRILRTILSALKLTKIPDKLISGEVYDVYNAITDAINNRTLDPDLDNCGEVFFYKPDLDVSWLQGEADNIIKRAINGLKASEKALKSRDKSPVQITKIQQDISQYQLLQQKGEDQQILIQFITRSSQQFNKVLTTIRKAVINPSILTNDDLKNFKNDFLDFYGPLTEDINRKLFYQGYFNDLPADKLSKIQEQLHYINKAYQEIQGKYNYLLKQRVTDIFRNYGKQYGFPTDDIESFINDKLNGTPKDMNMLYRYLQFTSNASDLGIRMVNRMMTDINSQVQWFTNNKTQDLIRQFSDITKSEQLLFFEKDKEGKTTGYLVRPLNYGQFKKDYNEFLSSLDSKYGVIDRNYYLLEDEKFVNYCKEKEEWLEKHCERKFKNSYYQEYNKLSQLARQKSKILSEQIQAIIQSVTDADGPHLERLSDSEWRRLDNLYSLKKNLSNDYNLDGSMKQGEDLAIAREFQRFYDAIGQGSIKSKTLSQEDIQKLIDQKQKELPDELFKKWFQRNISYQFTDDFIDAIKNFGQIDFGADTDLYNRLYEERRQLLQLGRDNNNPINIAEKYGESVKQRILELDKQITELRESHKGDKRFFDIASIIPTEQYKRDKAIAKSKGQQEYNIWYKKHHYRDAKGNERIASYYTRLVPKDKKYIEYRLSKMNQELDKNSNLINPNYNFEDPEYYQPKKSLYDNSKAYNEATKTNEQKKIYKLIVDTMDQANSKLSYMSKRDNYRLPQATGDFIDFTMRQGNFFKNFGRMVRDSITQKNDDVEFSTDNSITKADGSQLNLVPTHYVKMLEHPENISRNLIGLLSEYSRMAENYRLKNEYASQFDIIQDMYDTRTFTRRNALDLVQSNISGDLSNTSNKLKDYLEMQLYGRTSQPWTLEWKRQGKVYSFSVTKLLGLVQKYASASNLGNNFLSIAKSIIQGFDKAFVEGFAGQFYTMSDLGKSFIRQLWRTPWRILNIGNPKENDISYALLEHNGIAHDTREKVNGLQYNRGLRLLYKYMIWGGWQAADFMVKVPIVESVYANVKYIPEQGKFMSFPAWEKLYPELSIKDKRKIFNRLNTPSALDIYTVKDGKLVVRPEYKQYEEAINDKAVQQTLKNISSILCSRIDGQLQQEDKLKIFQNAIGAAIGMHRSFFIVNANENLFKGYQYNPLIEDYDEAKYTSGFVGIAKWIYNLYNGVRYLNNSTERSKNKKQFNNPEYYNFKRILGQLSIIGILALMVAIWLKPEADKDKDNYLKQSTGYMLDALRFEEFSEYNPLDLVNQIKSPSAAITPFENALNLVNPFKFDKNYSTDKIKSGYYKDMERWQRTLIKATPGLRGAWESQDARTKWKYLESQLDK